MKHCRNGHSYDSHYKECPICKSERKRKWGKENPEKLAEQKAAWKKSKKVS